MVSGATSLSLVRNELFTTMEEAESSLEHFIAERHNGSLLQQAVESLHQVRGTLNLVELTGAELLGQEMPELLLPAINDLRQAGGQPALPESFFFSVRLDHARPRTAPAALDAAAKEVEGRRLRQMYQVGLLGFMREQNPQASLKLMGRAMARLDTLYANEPRGRLCWVGAAAVEAQLEGQLLARKSRKQLFSRIDRELKQILANSQYETPRSLLKELLYLVALADSRGPTATPVRGCRPR